MPRSSRLAALAAGAAAYSFYEPYRYRLESKVVPIARPIPDVTVLHLSDTHLNERDARLKRFLDELPDRLDRTPDIVVATGDLVETDAGVGPLVEALTGLDARLGRYYVLGSHDYYRSTAPAYTKYFTGERSARSARRASTEQLEQGLQDKGWVPLLNETATIEISEGTIRIAGVDDPYLNRHRTDHIGRNANDVVAIGLVHAPDVVSEWMLNGFDLVLAGHTHGGQVRIPGVGALVTNCSLPAGLAAGLTRVGDGWLHVSRGLGTGRYTPIRFACTPETTLLTLTSAADG